MSKADAASERLDRFLSRAAAAYYAAREPFGAGGDFTTAPEITQAFGECLGLWAAIAWEAMGRPDPVLLVELGPGRGTLMADALRAVGEMVPPFRAAARVHLVETSPRLRAVQAERLGGTVAAWHDDIAALPPGLAIVIANEFLDALPIRQFVRRGGAWLERFVAAGAFVEGPADAAPALPEDAPEGAVQEVCEPARALGAALGARIAAQGGAALFLDYGPAESGFGDSLQAMARHGAADPLGEPGSADVTAHVDFAAFAAAARTAGAQVQGPLPQGVFLGRLGLFSRAAMLARMDPKRATHHLAAAQRLAAPEHMGRLFKAICLCHAGLPTLPGFEEG
ncbi:class I SAM-dependent methyltransferase [Neoroseomonas oryzicola]|uniref:Class I SAM-dependent methyltransferase n=1 Tax=Neoroseomonas oryzicola TaxID=535904 RepID=A0A9X9WQ37_9PROT|nr:SAM-dependent methyltransferase [Neoroseomonas oryzicola]MBR0662447.1 class I SAM-dependent methyltransferase [Neoroseomonas oryzicola]NKE19581.1 class I SAM-dependent methyltransferase [Neoroseomonas oryzicola]